MHEYLDRRYALALYEIAEKKDKVEGGSAQAGNYALRISSKGNQVNIPGPQLRV